MKRLTLIILLLTGLAFFMSPVHAVETISFNVKIINDSGYDDGDLFLYITGQNPDKENPDGTPVYNIWNFSTASFVDLTSSTDIDWTKMQCRLTDAPGYDASTHSAVLTMPKEKSGRIYFALDDSTGADRGFASITTFDPTVNAQPDFHSDVTLLFDKVEFDAQKTTSINMNTTNVDFFSIPFTFSAIDKNTQNEVTYGFNAPREAFFHEFMNVPASSDDAQSGNSKIFKKLVIKNNGSPLRILAPDKIGDTTAGWGDDKDYFDNFWNTYVDSSWSANRSIDIYDNNGVKWSATIDSSGQLTATSPTGAVETHAKATDGHLVFGGVGSSFDGVVGPILNSAIQRGVMHLEGDQWNKGANFYQGDNSSTSPVNFYGKILHKYALQNKCYALPYDDNYNWDPAIYIENGGVFTVTLGKITNQANKSSFQMNVSPAGSGTTTPAAGTESDGIFSGTPYMITAVPEDGFEFQGWTGDPDAVIEDSTKSSTYVTIKDGADSPVITANFKAKGASGCIAAKTIASGYQLHYCVEYGGKAFEFDLTSSDIDIWVLDMESFKETQAKAGCIRVTDDLTLELRCVDFEGHEIQLGSFLSYIGMKDGKYSWAILSPALGKD